MKVTTSDDPIKNPYGDGAAWSRGPLLGKGSFGHVHKATNRRPYCSSFPPEMAVKSAEVSVSDTLAMEKEILKTLEGCPYLIGCFGAEKTSCHGSNMVYYNLLLEYASGGSLADRIRKSRGAGLPEHEVRAYTRSLLHGLKHVHSMGYVHCDLKPDNVLLVANAGNNTAEFTAKIGDFGLAKKRESLPFPRGTAIYWSPESATDKVQEAPSDIWALGCVVLEMLTGKSAWEGKNIGKILGRIKAENGMPMVDPKEVVSEEARHFLKSCFVREPMLRFSAEMLLSHPYVECWSDDGFVEDISSDEEELADQSTVADDDDGLSWGHLLNFDHLLS